jgi:competence protein ComEA
MAWVVFFLLVWKSWLTAPAKTTAPATVRTTSIIHVPPAPITVYVIGAVKRPGLYHLPLDSRLISAIRAAGGTTINADIQSINLAAVAQDGTEIVVPATGEAPSTIAATTSHKIVPTGVRIPINQASVTTLESLPGIGVKKAQAIFDYRHVHGLFTSINQLSQVKGIGPKLLEKILPYLSLH